MEGIYKLVQNIWGMSENFFLLNVGPSQQYIVVLMPLGWEGSDWKYGDGQAEPCIVRCMGGAYFILTPLKLTFPTFHTSKIDFYNF